MAKRGRKPKGLGDTIESITEATGIKTVVEMFTKATGIDCGCSERKEKLNNLIPYRRNVNCLNEDEYLFLKVLYETNLNQLTVKQQYKIIDIYLNVFGVKLEHSNCSSCWRDVLADLRKVYNTYEINE
jgi:hypothetical protein